MYASKSISFIFPLFLSLFLLTSVRGDPIYYKCGVNEVNIYPNRSTQAGYGDYPETFLCRGDVKPKDCENCFLQASEDIDTLCPARLHSIWYSDHCFLQYTDKDVTWDSNIYYCSAGSHDVVDQQGFADMLWKIFDVVSANAASDTNYFSAVLVDLGDTSTLYAYGQCQNEITAESCGSCLQNLKVELAVTSCAKGSIGGRLVGGSCIIRYELYPFLDA